MQERAMERRRGGGGGGWLRGAWCLRRLPGFQKAANLPPVCIILLYNLQDVSILESQPHFLAWNEIVLLGVVIKMSPHVNLDNQSQRQILV